jgi:hypothetical protein
MREKSHEIEAVTKDVMVDDRKFISLRSEFAAEQMAALLTELQAARRTDRIALLDVSKPSSLSNYWKIGSVNTRATALTCSLLVSLFFSSCFFSGR